MFGVRKALEELTFEPRRGGYKGYGRGKGWEQRSIPAKADSI